MTPDTHALRSLDRLETDVNTFLGPNRKFLFDEIRTALAALPAKPMTEDDMIGIICQKLIDEEPERNGHINTALIRHALRTLKAANVLYVEE